MSHNITIVSSFITFLKKMFLSIFKQMISIFGAHREIFLFERRQNDDQNETLIFASLLNIHSY